MLGFSEGTADDMNWRERQYYQGGLQAMVWVVLWLSPDEEARVAIESVSSLVLGSQGIPIALLVFSLH